MDIRPYAQGDRENCLILFGSNTPRFFAAYERGSFERFLDGPGCPYFVMEHEGAIVGCGGYIIRAEQHMARLVWGMVRADLHGQGLGRFLLLFRLREIGKHENIQLVGLETSQNSALFFEKQGFRVAAVVQDGSAATMGRVELVKKLTVCT